jgi:uncharacterized protein YrrD
MNIDVGLDMPVVTSDGKVIGKVDRLVVAPDANAFLQLIVSSGLLFTTDRIVAMVYIDRVGAGAVHLAIDPEKVAALPPFVASEYQIAALRDEGAHPFAIGAGPAMSQPVLWRMGQPGRELHHVSPTQYVDCMRGTPAIAVHSILPPEAISLDSGTSVITADGRRLGTIADLLYADNGAIIGIVARTGLLHHEHVSIPRQWVNVVTHRTVRLKVTAEEVRATATAGARN